jgi:malate dehydrogenase (oxaloacetate-decarboxylating)
MATTITDEMCIEASIEISKGVKDSKLTPEKLLPTMDDWELYPRVAAKVGMKAIEQKIAQKKLSESQIYTQAKKIITRSRSITQTMMKTGLIKVK